MITSITFTCETCGDESTQNPFEYNKAKNHFCSLDCYYKFKVANRPEGFKEDLRSTPAYKEWVFKVLKEDNFTCQKCSQHGGVLNAHHILAFSRYEDLRLIVSNGITLCKECHLLDFHVKYGKLKFTDEDLFEWLKETK